MQDFLKLEKVLESGTILWVKQRAAGSEAIKRKSSGKITEGYLMEDYLHIKC